MDINSKEFAQFLDRIIEEKVKLILERELNKNNLVRAWVATVVSVSGINITVKLPGDDTHTITKKNRTGQTLAANDEVYLLSPTGDLNNAYVAIAKNKPT
jgi:hypothetical protein